MKLCFYAVTVLMFAALFAAAERPAYAYGDPGTGLLILQSAGAIVSGVLFFVRKRLRDLMSRRERRGDGAAR